MILEGSQVGSGRDEGGTYYAMHLVEAADDVKFLAVFRSLPIRRVERWNLDDGAIGLDSLGTGLIWPDKYA
jgi:hypothetical protein